jgi:hypothetical protein
MFSVITDLLEVLQPASHQLHGQLPLLGSEDTIDPHGVTVRLMKYGGRKMKRLAMGSSLMPLCMGTNNPIPQYNRMQR